MSYGMREIARATESRIYQLDVVSNNLANAATPGFKVERYLSGIKTAEAQTKGDSELYQSITTVDSRQGMIQRTDNLLDVAIQGEGYFTVQTGDGLAYTRNGNFTINKNKQLTTHSGEIVMGDNGPITINGRDIDIDNVGNVSVEGVKVGSLKIVGFEKPQQLTRTKESLFTDLGNAGMKIIATPDVQPRQLEMSNVDAIREMVEMVDIQRSVETYQKVIQTINDLDKLSVSRVGKLV
jgi:flagellar basal-body rod protein FlgF